MVKRILTFCLCLILIIVGDETYRVTQDFPPQCVNPESTSSLSLREFPENLKLQLEPLDPQAHWRATSSGEEF